MRPVRRGKRPTSPIKKYQDAKPYLIQQMGEFCNYCERHIDSNNLSVEHILPKGKFPIFEKIWVNFLLSCNSCNSAKSTERIYFSKTYLPDADNTFYAFTYRSDGSILPSAELSELEKDIANNTLKILGLDETSSRYIHLTQKRIEAWGQIEQALDLYKKDPNNNSAINTILNLYKSLGYFSIWMEVFKDYPDMKIALINASPSTMESGCFDDEGNPISPSPNHDGLLNGGKI